MSGEIIGVSALRDILPCRPSMLLLDRVFAESENKLIGLKSISMNEPCFMGHFPGHPILPGVLQVEAIAQLAEVGLWKRLDPERKGDFYIKELHKIKFRRPNNPGDRLVIEVELSNIGTDSAEFKATVKNNSGVACNANGIVAIRPKITAAEPIMPDNEFDKGESSVMSVNQIMGLIPHRYPFLFVDYVSKIEGSHVTGVKNTTGSEPIFRQYKDGYTVLMGAVQAEIIAQVGAIYMLSNENNKGKIAYFMGIDKSEMFAPVFPGDQLRLEVDIPDGKSKFGKGEGFMYVGDKLASHTCMLFAIVDP